MKTTININVGRMAFVIDNDAFESLTKYLKTLESHFKPQEGGDEIIEDIELRLAELFKSYLKDHEVLTLQDVENAIGVLGTPEDFEIPEHNQHSEKTKKENDSSSTKRKFYRDTENGMVGGVCSGTGAYFDIDPVWIRLAFVCAFIFGGTGFILYLILYAVIPEAKTIEEKLAMKGENADISNIEKKIREEAKNVSKQIKDSDIKTKLNNLFESILGAFSKIFTIILKVLGFFISAGGLLLLVTLTAIFFNLPNDINITIEDRFWSFDQLLSIFYTMFDSDIDATFFSIGIACLIIAPLFGIIAFGIKLLFNVKYLGRTSFFTLFGIFLIGIFCLTYGGFNFAKGISSESDKIITSPYIESKTIKLSTGEDYFNYKGSKEAHGFDPFLIQSEDDKIHFGHAEVRIKKSPIDSNYCEIIKSSRGQSLKMATNSAENIKYNYNINDSNLFFDAYYSIYKEDGFKFQDVNVDVYLKEGQLIYLDKSLKRTVYDLRNKLNMLDRKMWGKTWIMTEDGLDLYIPEKKDSI